MKNVDRSHRKISNELVFCDELSARQGIYGGGIFIYILKDNPMRLNKL